MCLNLRQPELTRFVVIPQRRRVDRRVSGECFTKIGLFGKTVLDLWKGDETIVKLCISEITAANRNTREVAGDESTTSEAAIGNICPSKVTRYKNTVYKPRMQESRFLEADVCERAVSEVSVPDLSSVNSNAGKD